MAQPTELGHRIIKKPQENELENRILGEPTLSIAELLDGFVDRSASRILAGLSQVFVTICR